MTDSHFWTVTRREAAERARAVAKVWLEVAQFIEPGGNAAENDEAAE
jgi:hypothetical protein